MNHPALKPHLFRHACKEFDSNKKISKQDFEVILEAGRLSPSSFGLEPWKILVIQNQDLRNKLREFSWGAQKQLATCSHVVIILARKASSIKFDKDYVKHIKMDIQNFSEEKYQISANTLQSFQKKDFQLLGEDEGRRLFEWSARQTYIMQANMMTTTATLGIDSCPIEGFNTQNITRILVDECEVNSKEFGISVMICFGYRAKEAKVKTRQKIEDIVEWFN